MGLIAICNCRLFHAYISATKFITCHGLSAAGTVEVIATLMQMKALRLHPTRNLEDPIGLSQASPGAKALVIASDIFRFMVTEAGNALTTDWSFEEPSGGAGAVAMLIGENPYAFQVDVGANG